MISYQSKRGHLIFKPLLYGAVLLAVFIFCDQGEAAGKSDEPRLGIGVAELNYDSNTVLRFYKDTSDKTPIHKLVFFNNRGINSYDFKDRERYEKEWLDPEALQNEDIIIEFRYDFISKKWAHVIVNNKTGLSYWVHNIKGLLTFVPWAKYMDRMVVSRIDPKKNRIRIRPDSASMFAKYDPRLDTLECFSILKLKGRWAQVAICVFFENNQTRNKVIGWIMWRSDDDLLVECDIDE